VIAHVAAVAHFIFDVGYMHEKEFTAPKTVSPTPFPLLGGGFAGYLKTKKNLESAWLILERRNSCFCDLASSTRSGVMNPN
jgi:hypothetical protein